MRSKEELQKQTLERRNVKKREGADPQCVNTEIEGFMAWVFFFSPVTVKGRFSKLL